MFFFRGYFFGAKICCSYSNLAIVARNMCHVFSHPVLLDNVELKCFKGLPWSSLVHIKINYYKWQISPLVLSSFSDHIRNVLKKESSKYFSEGFVPIRPHGGRIGTNYILYHFKIVTVWLFTIREAAIILPAKRTSNVYIFKSLNIISPRDWIYRWLDIFKAIDGRYWLF